MSSYKTHAIVGIIIGFGFYILVEPNFLFIMFSMLFSILPDIDIRTSKTYKWYVVGVISLWFLIYILPQTTGIFFFNWFISLKTLLSFLMGILFILQFIHHREFFHSLMAGIIFSYPLYYFIGIHMAVAGLISYYSHLLLDDELFDGVFT